MPLLIDCYNVLCAPLPPLLAGLDEGGLCMRLDRTPWARSPIVVVADGRPKPRRAAVSPVASVQLLFSSLEGKGGSADDVMIRRIRANTAPRRLIVVSSDRAIRDAARRRRAVSWSSEEFIHRLCRHLADPHARGMARGSDPAGDRPLVDRLPPGHVAGWLKWMGAEDL